MLHEKLAHLKVYSPGYQAIDWGFDYSQVVNLYTALAQPVKIAALPVFFDNPSHYAYKPEFEGLRLDQFDLVLFEDIQFEKQSTSLDWIAKQNCENWLLCVASMYSDETFTERTVYRPWWSFTFLQWNQPREDYPLDRPFLFDCLQGTRREHRDYVMLSLQQTGLLDRGIVTYRDIFPGGSITETPDWVQNKFPDTTIQWPYVSPNLDPAWEVREKLDNSISSIVPWEIYNRCNYTILVETVGYGNCYLMAEKIGKCLHARRLFVHFGAAHWLEQLRSLGFETFGSILDESYDSIDDDIQRWQQAFEQVKFLSQQDHPALLQQVKPILDHNHNRLYQFREEKRNELANKIVAYLK